MRMRVSATILFLLFPLGANAVDVSVDLGVDVLHKAGMGVYGVTFEDNKHSFSAMWFHRNTTLGLQRIFERKKWRLGLGAVYVQNTDGQVGTNWNFLLSASYRIKDQPFTPTFRHISHGRFLGIEKSKPNGGLNFLLLQTTIAGSGE